MKTIPMAAAAALSTILSCYSATTHAEPADEGAKKHPTTTMTRTEYKLGNLVIRQPWARATPKGAPVAGGYVTIMNSGKIADRLVGGTFAGAGMVQVHEMSVINGVMKMRHLDRGLEIKPGATVVLKPGSYHLMFMKLESGVAPGKQIKGSLVFEKAGRVDVEFAVGPIGSKNPPGAMQHHKH
ncbi:MAG: copper chaperone PCu(A)C [Beijerinckiaceae bacterium]|jgi:periplasmic copper chaperone A|nr:copper chaperone PCu(A)C [Beijerinckiaceae bacterium]